jgi:probable phosphoglycerate mutase
MRKIYLIRHGTPDFPDEQKRFIGQTNLPLSSQGKQEILKVKTYLSDKNIKKIYSSPMDRCKASAQLIAGNDIPIIIKKELKEINMGLWENKTFNEIKTWYPEDFRKRGEDFANFKPENGENFSECLKRGKIAFNEIAQDTLGNIAVVGHAGLNRSLLSWLQKRDLNLLFHIPQPYGCINILRENQGIFYFDEMKILAQT